MIMDNYYFLPITAFIALSYHYFIIIIINYYHMNIVLLY